MSSRYAVVDLGTLGGDHAFASAINSQGWVVGVSTTSSDVSHAFLYMGGAMRDLGALVDGGESYAIDLNDAGLVVGGAAIGEDVTHAVLWREGMIQDLGTLGGGRGYAEAVNNQGQVVGAARLAKADSRPKDEDELLFVNAEDTHAFLWERGNLRDLGVLEGDYSQADGINDAGVIVGSLSTSDNSIRAFVWDSGSKDGLRILEPLFGGGYSEANAIDAAGRIIGGSTVADGTLLPVLYERGHPRALPILPGYPITKAVAINARGEIVGHGEGGYSNWGETRALLWRDDILYDLNDLVQIGPGWLLTEARDINDAGQIVVNGQHEEQRRAFLLSPHR